ncbi:MAG TPA: anti-sigma factor domain-containing protein, partial [Clostridiales bacterium]|nr:anti-sigma factor domain-containing protein [Clostridiales bacterium]
MKAVVVEIKNQYVAVLTDDGTIIKVKNKNYALGQVIQLNNESPLISINKKIATFVASVAAIAVLGTGTWAYASPYSYVNLDINPSIEFTLNRFNRVLKVEATNEDGNYIIEEINMAKLKNEKIEDALSTTVDQISKSGYFNDQDEVGLVITASAKNKNTAEKLAKDLYETVDKELKDKGEEVEIQAYSFKLTNDKSEKKQEEEKAEDKKHINKITKKDTKAEDKARKKIEKEEKKSSREEEKIERKSSKEEEKADRKAFKEEEKNDKKASKELEKNDRKSSKELEKNDRKPPKEQEKNDRKPPKELEKNDRKPP